VLSTFTQTLFFSSYKHYSATLETTSSALLVYFFPHCICDRRKGKWCSALRDFTHCSS